MQGSILGVGWGTIIQPIIVYPLLLKDSYPYIPHDKCIHSLIQRSPKVSAIIALTQVHNLRMCLIRSKVSNLVSKLGMGAVLGITHSGENPLFVELGN